MVNGGQEDQENRQCLVLRPGGPLLVALVGQGYCQVDLVCPVHELPQQKPTPPRCFLASQELGTEMKLNLGLCCLRNLLFFQLKVTKLLDFMSRSNFSDI